MKEYQNLHHTRRLLSVTLALALVLGFASCAAKRISVTPTAGKDMIVIPDANFRAFCMQKGYADDEGRIIPEKAATVTTLNVSNQHIASLEGISYFTALTKLICDDNSLRTLDVSGCKALTYLACENNFLKKLDLAECKALTELYCENNALVTLYVTGCKTLTKLFCNNNRLEKLDVSRCKALTELCCENNFLETLDVEGYTVSIGLYCENHSIGTLSIAGCKALTYLSCHNNCLTTLNVSGTLKTTNYTLYCGNQKDKQGADRILTLTLAKKQNARWEKKLKTHENNKQVKTIEN